MHWALLLGTSLVLLSQLRGMWRLLVGSGRKTSRPRLVQAVVLDAGWVLFVMLWLPRVIGLTWRELFRGSPDLAWCLVATLGVNIATMVVRARLLQRA